MNNVFDVEKGCTGCGFCAAVCLQGALHMELNREGFYEPLIDEEKCIKCGICKKYCKKCNDDVVLHKSCEFPKVYAAVNQDKKILETSTSGGVATELADWAIDNGYLVASVKYSVEKNLAFFDIASTKEQIQEFRGSKYFQPYTEDTFRTICNSNDKYMVIGLPCHIYPIWRFAADRKRQDQFIFVDMFCHGCPTKVLWDKYLEWEKDKYKIEKIDKIEFRSKTYGWHEFCTKFIAEGHEYCTKPGEDLFYRTFFKDLVLNEACNTCKLRGYSMVSDIRIGDFWGTKYDLNTTGVSVCVINSERGSRVLEAVRDKFKIKEERLEDVKPWQAGEKEYEVNERERKILLDSLYAHLNSMLELNSDANKGIMNNIKNGAPAEVKKYIRLFYHLIRKRKV